VKGIRPDWTEALRIATVNPTPENLALLSRILRSDPMGLVDRVEFFRQRVIERAVRTEKFVDGSWRVHCGVCGSSWVGYTGQPPVGHPGTELIGDGPEVMDSSCPLAPERSDACERQGG
jgi:hypothetical protein